MTRRFLARCSALAVCAIAIACGSSEGEGGGGNAGASGAAASGGSAGAAGAGGAAGSSGSGGTAGSASCDVSQAAGVLVEDGDLDAFPPYAIDGCQLLYVAASGDLVLRDLTSGTETTIADAAGSPRRPTIAGSTLAWEADQAGKGVVMVSNGGTPDAVTGSFDHAGEPRAADGAVVYTAWLAADEIGDTDVLVFDVASKTSSPVGSGPKQQRFADISATHIAYSDFAEDLGGFYDPNGYSLADIVLVARDGGAITAIPRAGKQAFPMLGAQGVLAYLDWIAVHPVPKLQNYTIMSVPISDPTATPTEVGALVDSVVRVRPNATGTLIEWVHHGQTTITFYRAPADGSAPPTQIPISASELHAPVANETTTVLAVRPTFGAAPELQTIPR